MHGAFVVLFSNADGSIRRDKLVMGAGGIRRLAITIDRANIDYRKPLDRPVFSVSLHDADGRPLEAPQDTPPGHFDRGSRAITAGHTVVLRTPMRQMPPGECLPRALTPAC